MGFFSKVPFFKKKEELSDTPPDFSQYSSPGQPDPLTNTYTPDPLQGYGQSPFAQPADTNFDHEIFRDQPTNADQARAYAQNLSPTQSRNQGSASPTQGHELQLILERLDTIKAEMDAVKQRMIRVERYLDQAEQRATQRRY